MTRTFKKYQSLLSDRSMLSKQEIINLKSIFNRSRTNLTSDQVNDLSEIINDRSSYLIEPDHTSQGLDYLNTNLFMKSGRIRSNFWVRKLADQIKPEFVGMVLSNFDRFEFVGFNDISDRCMPCYQPIFKTISKRGDWFSYCYALDHIKIIDQHKVQPKLEVVK